MIFYSCVFSLGDAKKNEYIYMLMMLYSSLKKTKTLVSEDLFYLMADAQTAEVVREVPELSNIIILILDKPQTILEGMSWRYQLHHYVQIKHQDCCYLDVDMLCIKQFKLQIPLTNSILVYPEGSSSDNNYSGNLKPLKGILGYSSTIFAYNLGENIVHLFERIIYDIKYKPENHYTLDQPYFNHALQAIDALIARFPQTLLSFNGHNNLDEACFINYAGCPGDGAFHFLKGLQFMCCR